MYLLDTNIVSEFARKRPDTALLDWLTQVIEPLAISFSAVLEIQRGIEKLSPSAPEKAAALNDWLLEILASDITFLPMDAQTARIYAVMTMVPELECLWAPHPKAKRPKPGQDLAIAATALRYRAIVATANPQDFMRIHEFFPLPGVFDPRTSIWHVPQLATSANLKAGDDEIVAPHAAIRFR